MKFKPYPSYKDSGIDWLGDVPEHWAIKKIKYLFEIRKRIAGKEGFSVLSITQRGIKVKDTVSGEGQLAMDYSKYQFVEVGDFAMNHMDLLTGYVDISRFYGVTSPDYRVFSLTDSNSMDEYYLYLMQMGYTNKIFYAQGQGVANIGRWRFQTEPFNGFSLPYPNKNEQTAIANFLDRETLRIDGLVEEKNRFIELLKEKRQAMISHAVTKGLDPTVKMKDSGVEWLGEVPEHWVISSLKHKIRLRYGDPLASEIREDGEVEVFGSNGSVGLHCAANTKAPAIVVGRKGSYGKIVWAEKGGFVIDTAYSIDSKTTSLNLRWVYYELQPLGLDSLSQDTGVPGLARENAYGIRIAVPLLSEQTAIANFLDCETTKIDALITETQQYIALLKEHRTALISAAVTGKIDVREVA